MRGVKEDCQQVVQAPCGEACRHFERMRRVDIQPLVEEAVAAHSVSGEARDAITDLECRVTVDSRRLHPGGLAGHVVWKLVLEKDVGPAVAIPDHVELLEVLNEEAVGGHVVAVDDDAGVRGVGCPPDTVAVVGAPGPDVVEDPTVAVHDEARRRASHRCASDAEEQVRQHGWIRRSVVDGRVSISHPQQERRRYRAGVKEDAGDEHPRGARDHHRRVPVRWDECRKSESQHDTIGMADPNRLVQRVDARCTTAQRGVDALRGIGRPRDEKVADRDGPTRGRTRRPGGACGVVLDRGHEDVVAARRVGVEVWSLASHRAGRERRVGRVGEALGRRSDHAGKHLVPDGVGPEPDAAVPRHPLLLRAVEDSHRNFGIRQEAAARVSLRAAVVHEGHKAVDRNAPHGRSLGDRPHLI